MSALAPVVAISLVLVLVNGFFVLAEFASVRARRTRVEQLADEGDARAARMLPILEDPVRLDRFVATCQLAITATSLGLGFYGQDALSPILEGWLGPLLGSTAAVALSTLLALVILTTLQIVIGELVPKAVAVRHPERSVLLTAGPMRLSERLLSPLVTFFNGSANLAVRLIGLGGPVRHSHVHSPEEIELLMAESGRGGALDPVERQMLHNAFDLTQLAARQVMIPRNRLALASVETAVPDMLAMLAASIHSRIPVYEGTQDHVLGIVHLKDVFRLHAGGQGTVRDIVRPVPFVPETMPVGDLWQVLTQRQTYLAVVLDEYGGTAGLVTQEDLLEEIIGEVQDEFDTESEAIERLPGHRALVRGDVLVEHANNALGLELPKEHTDTMGGLVTHALGRVAEVGEVVTIAGTRLEVAALRGRSVDRVIVQLPASSGEDGDEDA
jgi:CBS domain containing-hemolysin-like protein